jgi:hypothetical protein
MGKVEETYRQRHARSSALAHPDPCTDSIMHEWAQPGHPDRSLAAAPAANMPAMRARENFIFGWW